MERSRQNGGILPDNVGPSGKIGEHMDGKWWGGYYGWCWPHGLFNQIESTLIGGTNAYSGQRQFQVLGVAPLGRAADPAAIPRGQRVRRSPPPPREQRLVRLSTHLDRPPSRVSLVHLAGRRGLPPHRRADPGDRPGTSWCTQRGKGDWEHAGFWLAFIEGRNGNYPLEILKATYAETLRRMELIRSDTIARRPSATFTTGRIAIPSCSKGSCN